MGIIIKAIRRSYGKDTRKEDDPTQLIKDYMERHKITNYIINPDKSVDVNDEIYIYEIDLIDGKIPFKFNKVNGNFNCNGINLTSLENSPKYITGSFRCIYNSLTSLENAPKKVDGSFYCNNNQLTSLEGCPEEVGGDFNCESNPERFIHEEVKKYCKVKGFIWV